MEVSTTLDGIIVALGSIVIVFVVLLSLILLIKLVEILVKKYDLYFPEVKEKEKNIPPAKKNIDIGRKNKTTAILTASVLAILDEEDKNYQITSIKRIR